MGRAAEHRWTDDELALLHTLANGEAESFDDLRRTFNARTGQEFTRAALEGRLQRIGLKASDVERNYLTSSAPTAKLRKQVAELQSQVKRLTADSLEDSTIRSALLGLRAAKVEVPDWLVETHASKKGPGVPVIFGTDWHWGEVVTPASINGVNEYNMEIARARARRLIERTIDLLLHHIGGATPKYPGIVFPFGGDLFSGNIHEELRETNEDQVYACLLDLLGVVVWCIETLADEVGHVFIPAVVGNHSRGTDRVRYKGSVKGSLDWLLYSLAERHFQCKNGGKGDPRVQFYVSPSTDALFQVYGTRILLTHGNQFRGGDGLIGCLGPIFRGDVKKRARNGQIKQDYDVLMLGHFHQDIRLRRLIVGGSLVGYNEYAHDGNFPFEPPMQPLFLVHPVHGITISAPIFVEEPKKVAPPGSWVAWQQVA